MDCSPPVSSVHGILQAVEWVVTALLQGIFPTQGSNLCLLCLPALAGGFFTISATLEAQNKLGNTAKKQTHRYREQTSGYQWEEGNEKGQQREGS